MKTIRLSTFETNSSSMHTLVLPRSFDRSLIKGKSLDFHLGDFSRRELILRTTPEDKASYMFNIIVGSIKFPNSSDRMDNYHNSGSSYYPYTEDEVTNLNHMYDRLNLYFDKIKNVMEENYGCTVTFSGLKFEISKYGYAYIDIATDVDKYAYWSCGCYGHDNLIEILGINRLTDSINKYISNDSINLNELDTLDLMAFVDIACLAFDKKAVLIQHTDECDKKDYKKHLRLVKKYVNKNGGNCTVDWPLGG